MSQVGGVGTGRASTGDGGDQLNLLDYWRMAWRRKLTVAVIVVVAVAAAICLDTVRTKQYTSTAQLLFLEQATSASAGSPTAPASLSVATDIQLVGSNAVKAKAARILHSVPPAATVTEVETTQVADISVTSSNSAFAADAANAYARAYITVSTESYLRNQLAAETALRRQLASIDGSIATVSTQLANTKAGTPRASSLSSQLATLSGQQASLQQQIAAIQLATSEGSAGGELAQAAVPATSPSSPRRVRDALIAGLIGFLAGIGVALLRDRLDDSIHSKADLEVAVGGMPVIGLIPMVDHWRRSATAYLVSADRPASPAAEAYRGLRTSIQFASFEKPQRVIQITSPASADGKTTTAANIAWTMAAAGQHVVLVDCDLRRPRVHEFFGISNKCGFTNVLIGESTLDEALVAVRGGLSVLPSGTIPPNPSELLSSKAAHEVMSVLVQRGSIVVVDSPPVLPVTDACVLGSQASGVVLVASAGISTRRQMVQALQTLTRLGAPVMGVVLNRSPVDTYGYWGYGSDRATQNASSRPSQGAATNGRRHNGSRDVNVARHAAPTGRET